MIYGITDDREVYLNGEWLPISQAKISVLDRGFIFGDGIYEVVPAYQGKLFRAEHHIARLMRSLKKIELQIDYTAQQWLDLLQAMLAKSPYENSFVYLQITRGVAKRLHSFPDPTQVKPTIFMMTMQFNRPSTEFREQGLKVVSMPDMRWLHCDIKSISLLGNVLSKQYAVAHQVDEVVQLRDGYLSEGAAANIWLVKNGVLQVPVNNNLILEGIRYELLHELAQQLNIPFESRPLTEAEVEQADEMLITSAGKEVLPITQYNGRPVGDGQPGPVYRRLRQAYDEAIQAL